MSHRHDEDRHSRHDHDHRFARSERGHDGPGHRHGRHGGGGRSGLGRFFAHGDLRLIVLNLIAEKPRHGYEIIKAIEDQVGGAYSPSPGVIYPTLTLLEELGYVAVSAAEAGKKLHQITDQGRTFLEANRSTLDALLARMAEASQARGSTSAPPIVRAVENLRLALRLRLSSGPLTSEQVDAIAALLDGAATSVEKI
jgi:DNA-binding PadR family transcriptional regulator